MQISIIGTESLGVRGLCTVVTAADRTIVIDPGVALGYRRHGLLPHPYQVYVGAQVRKRIITSVATATDIVISHYHGDHVPLVNANPFQLSVQEIADACRDIRFWCKAPDYPLNKISVRYNELSQALDRNLPIVDGTGDDLMTFSAPQPHGASDNSLGTVMMTRIADGSDVFVHASDLQLLDDGAVSEILAWEPCIVLVSGPPLYLKQISLQHGAAARCNALKLARNVRALIIDHHLMRSESGCRWLDDLASETGGRIMCAADFMGRDRLLLESWRDRLYHEMPVPEGWHDAYARGEIDIEEYEPGHFTAEGWAAHMRLPH
jgi:predicted metallo-beta-lactamase superfamily hydrolase